MSLSDAYYGGASAEALSAYERRIFESERRLAQAEREQAEAYVADLERRAADGDIQAVELLRKCKR